ncbi:MAG: thiazole biosynthesis protein [Candidatus Omnitrophica bacterium]|nr:thiazole biosynthesis protein [Candidatus Omnitrophota bacterium]
MLKPTGRRPDRVACEQTQRGRRVNEIQISRAILQGYHEKMLSHLESDVAIVGAGPAGLIAAFCLARQGFKVTVLEKRLSAGGGIWGGGMGMNELVVEDEALDIVDELGIRHRSASEGLHLLDACELASGLCFSALRAGATLLNLTTVEDVCIKSGRVAGVVANRSLVAEALPVDPLTFASRAVLDTTGHEAVVVGTLLKRALCKAGSPTGQLAEGPMNAKEAEKFVVEKVQAVYPGLWVAGMSVCAVFGGPRMGPIFGGMLLSGKRAAEKIAADLEAQPK